MVKNSTMVPIKMTMYKHNPLNLRLSWICLLFKLLHIINLSIHKWKLLTSFQIRKDYNTWPERAFCVVTRKPSSWSFFCHPRAPAFILFVHICPSEARSSSTILIHFCFFFPLPSSHIFVLAFKFFAWFPTFQSTSCLFLQCTDDLRLWFPFTAQLIFLIYIAHFKINADCSFFQQLMIQSDSPQAIL